MTVVLLECHSEDPTIYRQSVTVRNPMIGFCLEPGCVNQVHLTVASINLDLVVVKDTVDGRLSFQPRCRNGKIGDTEYRR